MNSLCKLSMAVPQEVGNRSTSRSNYTAIEHIHIYRMFPPTTETLAQLCS